MVRDESTHDRNRNRAQLLLIGAIAIAFIVLGIAVTLNTVVYTQTISSSDSMSAAEGAERVELEVERGVQEVVQEANRDGTDATNAVEDFASVYRDQTATSGPTVVSLDPVSEGEDGTRITDEDPVGSDEVVYAHSPAVQVGQLIVELDLQSSGDAFELDVGSERVTVEYTGSDVEIEDDSSPLECTIAPADSDELTVDLLTGDGTGTLDDRSECRDLFSSLRGEHDEIDVSDNGDELLEGYDVVVGTDSVDSSDGDEDPVPWTMEIEPMYDSKDLSVDRELEVDVYGDRL